MAFSKACIEKPHRIHVAEVVGIPQDGKLIVVTVCLDCGETKFHEHLAAAPGTTIRLLQEEKHTVS